MGENSNGLRATSTSSDRDASLSRPSTAQSMHQQDIPSFSSGQTYLQMLTKSAHPGNKSSTSSTIPSHNQDTRRHRHRHRHRQRSPIRRNSTRRSRSLSQPHYRTYQSYVPDFNSGGLYGPYSGTPSSRGVASSDKYRPSEPQPYCGTPSSRGVASTDRYRPSEPQPYPKPVLDVRKLICGNVQLMCLVLTATMKNLQEAEKAPMSLLKAPRSGRQGG
jgi:hypothetical protein